MSCALSGGHAFQLRVAPGPPGAQSRGVRATGAADAPCLPSRAAVLLSAATPDGPEVDAPSVSLKERLRLFWRLAVPYFEQAEGAKLNFGLMLLLVLINAGISVIFSYVGRDFYSALSAKDQALFLEKTANFALGLAVATPLTVLYKFQRQRLALNWRQWMTTELARQYYAEQTYYKIEIDPEIDNPDQRITEDVTAFTAVSLDFFITLVKSAIDLVSFSGILYSIYPNLFYAIFLYADCGMDRQPLEPVVQCALCAHDAVGPGALCAAGTLASAPSRPSSSGRRSSGRTPYSCCERRTCATRWCDCARTLNQSPSIGASRRRRPP